MSPCDIFMFISTVTVTTGRSQLVRVTFMFNWHSYSCDRTKSISPCDIFMFISTVTVTTGCQ
jgi:hypothetical protein